MQQKPPITFATIDQAFLRNSFEWLSEPSFQKLTLTDHIDRESQLVWFAELSRRVDYKIYGAKLHGEWVGACGLKNINSHNESAEYWGYLYPLHARGKGFGLSLFNYCCDLALQLKLRTIYLKVSADNLNAIRAYKKWGFRHVEKKIGAKRQAIQFQGREMPIEIMSINI